jgi:protein-S-isoprenylcysteine O-methyltransferase Ste14
VYLASVPALLASGLFVLWIDRIQIPSEEAALGNRFGASYEAYRKKVRRWI